MTVHSFFQQSLDDYYSAARMRILDELWWPSNTDGVRLVGPNPLKVTAQATPDMSVRVNAGWARKGNYLGCNDDPAFEVTLDDADGANPRLDRIVMQWTDTENGDAASDAVITKITGDPDPTPSLPSTVGLTVVTLAHIEVAAGATSIVAADIDDDRHLVSALDMGRATYLHTGTNLLASDGSWTVLTGYTAAAPDTLGIFPSAGAFAIPADGFYELAGQLSSDPGSLLIAGIFNNGDAMVLDRSVDSGATVTSCKFPTFEAQLAAGDQLTLRGRAAQPGIHAIQLAGYTSFIRIKRIG